MEPVNNLSQVLAILRRQMSARSGKLATRSSATTSRSESGPPSEALVAVQRKIQERIRTIDPNDERRQSKAMRFFIEGVLQHEFGESMLTDPAFFALIDDVQGAMESDAEIRQTMGALIQELST